MSAEKQPELSEPQLPAPVIVVSDKTPTVTEKARPATHLTVATDEIGLATCRVRTAEGQEKLAALDHVPTHNSLIGFPSNVYDNKAPAPPVKGSPTSSPTSPAEEVDEWAIYNRFGHGRKIGIAILMGFCGLISPISSTALLAALPEVANDYGTTGTVISLSNALYLFVMGFSPPFWGPMSQVYGRKPIAMSVLCIVMVCSVGTALSPNLGSFFFFRLFTGFAATSLMVLGSAVVGDLFHPTERSTGLGYYLMGPLFGPSVGPFMGSVVITFAPWRVIYWVQAGMCLVGLVGVIVVMPETLVTLRKEALVGMNAGQKFKTLAKWSLTNPIEMFRLLKYPNLICIAITASALTWNQYGLLTPIRYVLNPRFGLTSPLQSGFLFLAPGVGALTGSLIGSRWADHTVRKWVRKRCGVRVPEDRLRSFLLMVLVLMPACQLIYGWSVEKEVGGLPVPIIFMFLTGVGQMISFPSTDTYLLDVKQERAAEVIGGNFMIKFWAAAVGSAVALPMTQAVGVGWYSTLSAGLLFLGGVTAAMAAYWGQSWRDKVDDKKRQQEEQAAGGVAEVVGGGQGRD